MSIFFYNLYIMIPKQINIIWLGDKKPNIPYLEQIKEMYSDYKIKI